MHRGGGVSLHSPSPFARPSPSKATEIHFVVMNFRLSAKKISRQCSYGGCDVRCQSKGKVDLERGKREEQGTKRREQERSCCTDDGSVGLSEGVRTIVPLFPAKTALKMGEKQRRENKEYSRAIVSRCRRTRNDHAQGESRTRGVGLARGMYDAIIHADLCMPSTRVGVVV